MIHAQSSRRTFLRSLVGGSLVLPAILSELLAADAARSVDPLSPKQPHHAPKAKRVIFLFSTGGVSHMDTFDPKPKLFQADGKTMLTREAIPLYRVFRARR